MKIILFLNHRCNLGCRYCYNGPSFDRPMPEETMRRGVEMAFSGMSSAEPKVTFFGGEPLIELRRMRTAVAQAKELAAIHGTSVKFSVTTNGTLLDEAAITFLHEEGFDVVVSIDGCQEAHDRTRPFNTGASSYEVIARNIRDALVIHPRLETMSVLDPANVELMPQSIESLLGLGVKHLHFSVNYEADWNEAALAALERSVFMAADRYVELLRQGFPIRIDLLESKIITHLKEGYSCRDRCKFGDGELCVSPTGRLYPCERLVGQDEREDVCVGTIETGVDLGRVLALVSRKNAPQEDCQGCAVKHRCMSWCGCVNYATTGDVGRTSGLVCYLEQLFIRAADKLAEPLYAERNPIFMRRFYEEPIRKSQSARR